MNRRNYAGKQPIYLHLGDDDDVGEHNHGGSDGIDTVRAVEHAMAGEKPLILQERGVASARGGGHGGRTAPEDEEELPPSKTKIKKQMHELRDLGKELTELGKDQLAQLDIPDNLRDALREMKNINKFGAQRRQLQYIGKLMREVDPAPILARLDVWKGKSQHHIAYLHQLERWRDRLMTDNSALTELLTAHPQVDAQHLRTLIRNAQKEMAGGKPPVCYREIFQVLRAALHEPD